MAAIDKLYVKNYSNYDELRRWAMVYYPELLIFFYNIVWDWTDYEKSREDWAKRTKEIIEIDYKKLGKFQTEEEAIVNLQKHYKESANYECSFTQARYEAKYIIENYNKTLDDLKYKYSFPVMNCPFSADRKLKWTCPLSFVREYLHEQCGVNPKWEWLYKIFWKGKKYFL